MHRLPRRRAKHRVQKRVHRDLRHLVHAVERQEGDHRALGLQVGDDLSAIGAVAQHRILPAVRDEHAAAAGGGGGVDGDAGGPGDDRGEIVRARHAHRQREGGAVGEAGEDGALAVDGHGGGERGDGGFDAFGVAAAAEAAGIGVDQRGIARGIGLGAAHTVPRAGARGGGEQHDAALVRLRREALDHPAGAVIGAVEQHE